MKGVLTVWIGVVLSYVAWLQEGFSFCIGPHSTRRESVVLAYVALLQEAFSFFHCRRPSRYEEVFTVWTTTVLACVVSLQVDFKL